MHFQFVTIIPYGHSSDRSEVFNFELETVRNLWYNISENELSGFLQWNTAEIIF